VDGALGDKLYILSATLPEGSTLATVPKAFFGDAIFNAQGTIVKGGTGIDEYKVSSSKLIEAPEGAISETRRRLGLKYTTVTGNQLLVERRAVVDAYEVGNSAYMILVSATAIKWEASEKVRCERVADSFFVGFA